MSHLKINSPGVVHEQVVGEAVIVNLDNGHYFSTDQVGAVVWSMIAQAHSVAAIMTWATSTYDDSGSVQQDLEAFLGELQSSQLVSVVAEPPEPSADVGQQEAPKVYEKPELHTFADMEELLLLDPVHDIGEQGWPSLPQ